MSGPCPHGYRSNAITIQLANVTPSGMCSGAYYLFKQDCAHWFRMPNTHTHPPSLARTSPVMPLPLRQDHGRRPPTLRCTKVAIHFTVCRNLHLVFSLSTLPPPPFGGGGSPADTIASRWGITFDFFGPVTFRN